MFLVSIIGIFTSIVAVALILIVLMQKPKGDGMTALSNTNMQQLVGVAEMPSLLEKMTYGLLGILFALTFLFTYLLSGHYGG